MGRREGNPYATLSIPIPCSPLQSIVISDQSLWIFRLIIRESLSLWLSTLDSTTCQPSHFSLSPCLSCGGYSFITNDIDPVTQMISVPVFNNGLMQLTSAKHLDRSLFPERYRPIPDLRDWYRVLAIASHEQVLHRSIFSLLEKQCQLDPFASPRIEFN